MKRFAIIILLSAVMAAPTFSQDSKQETKKEKKAKLEAFVKQLVESQVYDFMAQSAIPTGGRTLQLTSDYFLKVRKDSVISDLPYFGKTYTANLDGSNAGVSFKSTDFTYEKENGKKGSWDIKIKPKDDGDTHQMSLHISSDGYSTLMVTFTARQNISFYGYIRERQIK